MRASGTGELIIVFVSVSFVPRRIRRKAEFSRVFVIVGGLRRRGNRAGPDRDDVVMNLGGPRSPAKRSSRLPKPAFLCLGRRLPVNGSQQFSQRAASVCVRKLLTSNMVSESPACSVLRQVPKGLYPTSGQRHTTFVGSRANPAPRPQNPDEAVILGV